MAYLKRDAETSEIPSHDVHTILGPESSFEGKLVFDGTVRIDGKFKGEVRANDNLVIGQGAKVEATLHVGHVVVHGEVVGDITARQAIEVHAPARIRGNLVTPQLMIAKGVIFEGNCKMVDEQRGQANSPTGSSPIALVTDKG